MNGSVLEAAARVDEEDAERRNSIGGVAASIVQLAKEAFPDRLPSPAVEAAEAAEKAKAAATQAEADVQFVSLIETIADDEDWAETQAFVGRFMKRGGRNPLEPLGTDSRALRTIVEIAKGIRLTKRDAPDTVLMQSIERHQAVARALAGGKA